MEGTTTTTSQMPNPATLDWKEQFKRKMFGTYLAERATGLEHIRRAKAITERLALKTQDGTLGQPGIPDDAANLAEDEMGVHVGDIWIQQPPQPQATSQPTQSNIGKLATAAILAAGLSGPIGALAGGYAISKLTKPTTVQQEPTIDTDTDTLYELRLVPDEEPE